MPSRRWTPSEHIDFAASVARFTRWSGDPMTLVDDGVLYRVTDGEPLPYAARQLRGGSIEVRVDDGNDPSAALEDLKRRLSTHLPVAPLRALARRDRVIREAWDRRPGYRPPLTPDLFESLVTSITAQQVNLTWAATTRRRLIERYGTRRRFSGRLLWQFPTARSIAGADPGEIRAMQFTNAKVSYLIGVAGAVATGGLAQLDRLGNEAVMERLMSIRGVGRWTAEWTLARCLGRPDAIAAGDLGVRKAVGSAYLGRIADEEEVREITQPWGPAANWATHLLLEELTDPR